MKQLRKASRERDPEGKKKAREDSIEISRQIYSLTDKVKNNIGDLPQDWWQGTAARKETPSVIRLKR
jgi:hypothetical protein